MADNGTGDEGNYGPGFQEAMRQEEASYDSVIHQGYAKQIIALEDRIAELKALLTKRDRAIAKLMSMAFCPKHDMGEDFVDCTCPASAKNKGD